ncbi:MAG: cysteine desulfurase-like protein [Gammaproteobacteria bacterium]|nr:cysteine desulfurase-like protein [Gammaproteobacteria bacterium]
MPFNPENVRSQFPALSITDNGKPRIYLDNPAGTQVPQIVIDRMVDCLLNANANLGGHFKTSKLADAVVDDAHRAMADFLNASSSDEIIFGQNMTTITLHVSRSIGKTFSSGDEIILTQMDHDANVHPWVLLARDLDLKIRWLPFDRDTFEFDLSALDELLNERTKLVCVGGASNLTGTINDITEICRRARAVGAMTYIDAVQSAPHVVTDVQAIGCDFLVLSAYKFFGPHQGILWGRREVLESLQPYKVRPAPDELPWCFETGTQSHEGMAGTAAAVDYFAWIGETMAEDWLAAHANLNGRRKYVRAAMDCLFDYERSLSEQLLAGLQSLPGITIQGITGNDALDRRVPTVAFTHASARPANIAKQLAERGIFVWSGHNYALEAVKSLGILDTGGAVRVGPVHYNNANEINKLLDSVADILG